VLFTSIDLITRVNESDVLNAVGNYAISDGLRPSDFELRVVDTNVSFFMPSLLTPYAPPTLIPGDCSNLVTFNAYFVGDNSTSIKHIKSLFDRPFAGERERSEGCSVC